MKKESNLFNIITTLIVLVIIIGVGIGGYFLIQNLLTDLSETGNQNNEVVENKVEVVDSGYIPVGFFYGDYYSFENLEVYSQEFINRTLTKDAIESNTDNKFITSKGFNFEYRLNCIGLGDGLPCYIGNLLPSKDYNNYSVRFYNNDTEIKEVTLSENGSFLFDNVCNILDVKYKGKSIVLAPIVSNNGENYVKALAYVFVDDKLMYGYGFADYSLLDMYVLKYKLKPAKSDTTPININDNKLLNSQGADMSKVYNTFSYSSEAGDIYKKDIPIIRSLTLYDSTSENINIYTKMLYLGNLFPGYDLEKCSLVIAKKMTNGDIIRERYYLTQDGYIKLNLFDVKYIYALSPQVDNIQYDLNNVVKTTKNYLLTCKYKVENRYFEGFLTYSDIDKFIEGTGAKIVDNIT